MEQAYSDEIEYEEKILVTISTGPQDRYVPDEFLAKRTFWKNSNLIANWSMEDVLFVNQISFNFHLDGLAFLK